MKESFTSLRQSAQRLSQLNGLDIGRLHGLRSLIHLQTKERTGDLDNSFYGQTGNTSLSQDKLTCEARLASASATAWAF
jgi:hypothetical protein